jgi:LPS-assembly protein
LPAVGGLCSGFVIRRFSLLYLLILVVPLGAQDTVNPADLSAETSDFNSTNNTFTFRGNARLSDGQTLLEADTIHYNYATGIATAEGHVSLTRGAERILTDKASYDRKNQSFTLAEMRAGRFPYFISGESAQGNMSTFIVSRAELSYREPGPYQPTLNAGTLTYKDGKTLNAEAAHIGIGSIQPFSLPHFTHHLNLPLVSYLSFNGGYRSSLGVIAEAGLHLPLGADTRLGGTLGIYTARGIMFGPTGSYDIIRDNREMVGDIQSGFINDHGDRLTDLLGRPVQPNRGYVQWWHAQDLTDSLRVTAQVNYWADSEVLRDFRPRDFFRIQEPDNYVQALHTGANYFVSAFTRFAPNDFQRVQERLPEVTFDVMPLALGGGFYQRFHGGFAALREASPGNAGPVRRSDRLDAYYAINRPITHEDWFSFTPIVGARVTHYKRAVGAKDNYTRTLGEIGFDAAIRYSAVNDYRNDVWQINGIRHLLTPRLGYRYIPDAQKGRAYIPTIDDRTFTTYLPPMGLGDTRNIDDLGPTNVLRIGLDNTWQTRDTEYGSRDLLVFNLANDFRFERSPTQRTASDLHSFLAFMPAAWLQFDYYQRLSTHDFTLQEFNTSVSIHDGDAWRLQFSSHFLRQDIEEYVLQYEHRLNEAYEILTKFHYDNRRRRFNEQAFGLRQNLGNTWSVEYLVTVYDGPRRESNFGFNIAVETFGF